MGATVDAGVPFSITASLNLELPVLFLLDWMATEPGSRPPVSTCWKAGEDLHFAREPSLQPGYKAFCDCLTSFRTGYGENPVVTP